MSVIKKDFVRVKKEIIDQFKDQSTPNLCEAMGKKGALHPRIKPIYEGARVCGSSLTVFCPAGDNLMLHKALQMAKPGDVLVCDAQGYEEAGMWGETMSMSAMARGVAGLVIDGAVRDRQGIKHVGFPVFARNICPNGTSKEKPGLINVMIRCGGQDVSSGDIVVGDDDGVVVVPQSRCEDVLQKANERKRKEDANIPEFKKGKLSYEIQDLESVLRKRGVTEI